MLGDEPQDDFLPASADKNRQRPGRSRLEPGQALLDARQRLLQITDAVLRLTKPVSKFREVTLEAGVGGSTNDWSTCAAFFDYDNDGKLDLFVGNYVNWSREIDAEVGYKIDGRTRAYGQPVSPATARNRPTA